jgi:hypothetical protein
VRSGASDKHKASKAPKRAARVTLYDRKHFINTPQATQARRGLPGARHVLSRARGRRVGQKSGRAGLLRARRAGAPRALRREAGGPRRARRGSGGASIAARYETVTAAARAPGARRRPGAQSGSRIRTPLSAKLEVFTFYSTLYVCGL